MNTDQLTELRQRIVDRLLAGEKSGAIAVAESCHRATVWRVRQEATVKLALATRASARREEALAVRDEALLESIEYVSDCATGREKSPSTVRLAECHFLINQSGFATLTPSANDRVQEALSAAAGGPDKVSELIRRHVSEALGVVGELPPPSDGEHQPPTMKSVQ